MPKPPSATKPDLASAMYPSLLRDAKAKEAWQARTQAEQQTRLKRTAANLQTVIDALRRERGG